jgi:predicted MPP superfamily phosphohydrolase
MDLKKSLSGIFGDLNDIKILDVTGKKYSHEGSDVLSDSDKHSFSDENELKIQESNYMAETEGIINTKEYREELSSYDKKYHVINEDDKLIITLIHTPDSYALVNLAINGIDIVFAGHTHGGQVRAPGVGALISGCNLKTKYAAGLFYFKNFVLQVSKGLGEGRFSRFRINCSPEAIITEIVREQ